MDFNLDEFVKNYHVHPETLEFLKAAAASGAKPYYEIGVSAARESFNARSAILGGKVDLDGCEEEICIPSPDVEGITCSNFMRFSFVLSIAVCENFSLSSVDFFKINFFKKICTASQVSSRYFNKIK